MIRSNKLLGISAFLIVAVVLISTVMLNNTVAKASVESQIRSNLADIQRQIEDEIPNHPGLAASSNPYDYIKHIKATDKMIKLGYPALPYIEETIDQSEGSGLMDYILADAAEQIAKVHLKQNPRTYWDNGNMFSVQWKKLLKNTPHDVKQIADSSRPNADKITSLVKMGLPAVPFIIEEVERGKSDLLPAILEVAGGDSIELDNQESRTKLIGEMRIKYKDLRKYVLSK